MIKIKLFSYDQLNTFVHRLSGSSKLIDFLVITTAIMFCFDLRILFGILVFSTLVLISSKVPFKRICPLLFYVGIFLLLDFIFTLLITPYYGVEIFETKHVLFHLFYFDFTIEQLYYQLIKLMKYFCAVPLGIVFFLTTNPSEFASSINSIGINYRICTSISLTLRYFPDVLEDYTNISNAQAARGLDMSKNVSVFKRIKNTSKILIPLIFSTMDRIEAISNAMELRSFGKYDTKSWYTYKSLGKEDYLSLVISILILAFVLIMRFCIVKATYFNPFV